VGDCFPRPYGLSKTLDGEDRLDSEFMYIGMNWNNAGPYSGVLDEVRFWNRALPHTEVAMNWNKALSPVCDPLHVSYIVPDAGNTDKDTGATTGCGYKYTSRAFNT
jgi:hypothetical protein